MSSIPVTIPFLRVRLSGSLKKKKRKPRSRFGTQTWLFESLLRERSVGLGGVVTQNLGLVLSGWLTVADMFGYEIMPADATSTSAGNLTCSDCLAAGKALETRDGLNKVYS